MKAAGGSSDSVAEHVRPVSTGQSRRSHSMADTTLGIQNRFGTTVAVPKIIQLRRPNRSQLRAQQRRLSCGTRKESRASREFEFDGKWSPIGRPARPSGIGRTYGRGSTPVMWECFIAFGSARGDRGQRLTGRSSDLIGEEFAGGGIAVDALQAGVVPGASSCPIPVPNLCSPEQVRCLACRMPCPAQDANMSS